MVRTKKREFLERHGQPHVYEGCWYRERDDNFAVKTIHGQVMPGFKTKAKAKQWTKKRRIEKGWKIINSPWYLDTDCHAKKLVKQARRLGITA